jgi:hypothetical protein
MWLLHVGTWLRDAPTIRTILDHMREGAHHGPVVDCLTVGGNAAIAALEGRAAEALTLYQRARAVRRELGLRFEEALLGVDMATVLDTTLPEVAEAIEQSRTVLAELGAKPFLARLETAARGTGESASGNGSSAEAIPVAETEVAAG